MSVKSETIAFEYPRLEMVPGSNGEQHRLMDNWSVTFLGESYDLPRDFVTDGASIPKALRFICGSPYQEPRLYAALVHDWLYSGGDPEATRAEADALFRDMQIALGISKIKARIEWAALRLCGGSHWEGK